MKTLVALMLFCPISLSIMAQDISLTFTGTGASVLIDSVRATNLRTNESVGMPGDQTLVLTTNTGIPGIREINLAGMVFPNPFSGNTSLTLPADKPQVVHLSLKNLAGQVIIQSYHEVKPGYNEFSLTVKSSGIYVIICSEEEKVSGYKIICTGETAGENRISHTGLSAADRIDFYNPDLKGIMGGYYLGYELGDVIHYACFSGTNTTHLTDAPSFSKEYEIEFAACIDTDRKNYPVVKIGSQLWMAQNLACLPAVSPSLTASETDPHYYVYGYEGTDTAAAKRLENYCIYGVLYNWTAAMDACPEGWKLPDDEEWKIMEIYLGMSESDADTSGYRYTGLVGRKLKSASGWNYSGNGSNSSGFNAFPGGTRIFGGGFVLLGSYGSFWTSSQGGPSTAWYRDLGFLSEAVYRSHNNRRVGYSVRCLKK